MSCAPPYKLLLVPTWEKRMPVVQINGIGIHYQESGDRDKPTIVFAHPLMWGPGTFAELLTEIARDTRLLTVDLHGHGLSGYREAMTLEEMAEDYYGLLQEMGLGRVASLGCGIGGIRHARGACASRRVGFARAHGNERTT